MQYRLVIDGQPGEWLEGCKESLEAMATIGNECDPGSCVVESRPIKNSSPSGEGEK